MNLKVPCECWEYIVSQRTLVHCTLLYPHLSSAACMHACSKNVIPIQSYPTVKETTEKKNWIMSQKWRSKNRIGETASDLTTYLQQNSEIDIQFLRRKSIERQNGWQRAFFLSWNRCRNVAKILYRSQQYISYMRLSCMFCIRWILFQTAKFAQFCKSRMYVRTYARI